MMIKPFKHLRMPQLIFGPDTLSNLPKLPLVRQAQAILLVTGGASFIHTPRYAKLKLALGDSHRTVHEASVAGEPSPELVDSLCAKYRDQYIGAVIAIGGGSALDTGKALSAMLPVQDSVTRYLEGVGTDIHPGYKIPFIAIPTTAGTGSEATANAVLSQVGPRGYKRSLRHENFVPDIAILDPTLTLSCPPEVTAAAGLDALTQLMEGYVSTKATPLTDALALDGIRAIGSSLIPACTTEGYDVDHRGNLAYAAYLSGVVLANAGLGLVHGFASPIGGLYGIPHGMVCGTLQGEALRVNLQLLKTSGPAGETGLKKYAAISEVLTGCDPHQIDEACSRLLAHINGWIELLRIPTLGAYGIMDPDLDAIVVQTDEKNNPVPVSKELMREILVNRL